MSNSKIRQDLPPPGGYKPIQYLRIPAKTYFSGTTMFAGFLAIQFGALYIFSITRANLKREAVEERSARIALQPMLYAEKDRAYLKEIGRIRDEEERLMKDVPGWEVGTYWGEPVYKTRPANEWKDLTLNEYYVHNSQWDFKYAMNFYKWF